MWSSRLYLFMGIIFSLAAVYDAYRLRWLCDDAFISFRYAIQMVRGEGLVFNPGEPVEGYTNFLWTVLIGVFSWAGVRPEVFAIAAGLLFYSGTLLLLLLIRPENLEQGEGKSHIPFAMVSFALIFHGRIFATSGLEVSLFTLVLTGAVLLADKTKGKPGLQFLLILSGVSLTLIRPEGFLYLVFHTFYVLGDQSWPDRRKERSGTRISLVVLGPWLLLLAWLSWKLQFYGDLLPNTYYAKSGGASYFEQGFRYYSLFFQEYPALALPFLLYPLELIRRAVLQRKWMELLVDLPVLIHLFYIWKVGGDFMFARFLVPLLPVILYRTGEFVRSYTIGSKNKGEFVLGVLLVLLSYRNDIYRGLEFPRIDFITDEHRIYPLGEVRKVESDYKKISSIFQKHGIRTAFYGTEAMQIYYLDPVYAFEAVGGLTDRELARRPIEKRGRPGHEKRASFADYQKRGIDLLLFPDEREPHPNGGDLIHLKFNQGTWRLLKENQDFIKDLEMTGLFRLPERPGR